MPRKRPDYLPGRYYHFGNRGAHRVSIFREPDKYVFVLRQVKHYVTALDLTVLAYCLLPNHYHLLIRQNAEDRAGLLPQRVFNSYSKAYNQRYDHSGTLFEGPYRVVTVEHEGHLLHLCRYIHANPVTHGIVSEVGSWPYSNYLEWTGERDGTLVDRPFVREHFPSSATYRKFSLNTFSRGACRTPWSTTSAPGRASPRRVRCTWRVRCTSASSVGRCNAP